ncbi:MAG TPA: hypothetical protein VFS08_14615, partial [Gemmatimonadaceae bacterium]|nr:hypothetical protein [Gemmatimonadaceae bacterium]
MSESRVGSRLHGCLRGFPAAALELSADGYVMDSNGRLEALLGQGVVNRPFAELLDTTSRAKWARLLAGRDRGDAPAGELWEFVLEGRSALELRTFAAVWGHDGNEAVLWLIEYSRDLRLEPLYEELSAANAELVQAQRELAKERTRLARAHALEAEARATAERAVRLR